jgi:acetylornithine deacetylase/succinyl-diaminopimelate desuccinylase-like protein
VNLSPTELTSQLVERLPIRHSPGVSDALDLAGIELSKLGLDHDVRPYGGTQQITATHAFSANGPHVIVNAHIDIEPFLPEAGAAPAPHGHHRVYGPGASDMLGGIAATISALRGLTARDDLTGRITVQLVVGAHLGGAGTAELLSDRGLPPADLAIIPEPTGGHVCTAAYSFARYQLQSTGDAGAMATATDRTNAATHAATALLALNAADQELRTLYPTRQQVRYVLPGLIHAGHDAAAPATKAMVEFAVALPPLLPQEVALDVVRRHMAERFAEDGLPLPSWETGTPLFPATDLGHREFAEVLRKVNPVLGWCQYPCPSDARAFQDAGIAVVLYGPGELSRTRRPGEYVEAGELEEFATTLGSALGHWLAEGAGR